MTPNTPSVTRDLPVPCRAPYVVPTPDGKYKVAFLRVERDDQIVIFRVASMLLRAGSGYFCDRYVHISFQYSLYIYQAPV